MYFFSQAYSRACQLTTTLLFHGANTYKLFNGVGCFRLLSLVHIRKYVFLCNEITIRIPKVHSFLKQCLHDIHFMKTSYPQLKSDEGPCFKNEWNLVRLSLLYVLISVVYLRNYYCLQLTSYPPSSWCTDYGHWTPNEGIYQRYLKTKYVSAVPKFWDWD